MYHGIINVYKEAGYTSHDVVAKLRGICGQKKIGHTGTLDPDAVGVLPVCLGNGTRLCDMLTDRSKEYVAGLRLGITTDTQDISGQVLEEKEVSASPEKVRDVIASFLGDSMQVPPMYSALKVNGKKLYELAREGKVVERAARPITVYEIEIQEKNHPDYCIRVKCSKGTYIRTLCHDIGQSLGCGGVMTSLTRTRVGEFEIGHAYTLDRLQEMADQGTLSQVIVPVDKMFEHCPALRATESAYKALRNGNQLQWRDIMGNERAEASISDGTLVRVYSHHGSFFGVYGYEKKRERFSPVKMFIAE